MTNIVPNAPVTMGIFAKAVSQPSGKPTAENAVDGVVFLRSGSVEAQHKNAKNPEKNGNSLINRLPGQDLNLE